MSYSIKIRSYPTLIRFYQCQMPFLDINRAPVRKSGLQHPDPP